MVLHTKIILHHFHILLVVDVSGMFSYVFQYFCGFCFVFVFVFHEFGILLFVGILYVLFIFCSLLLAYAW